MWVDAGERVIEQLHKYEKHPNAFVTIQQGEEPEIFWADFKSYKATL
jgi:hypothetical protein